MNDEFASHRRIHGNVARKIGIEIVSGQRKPGDVLGGEIGASEDLGISRTAYREAIRMLAAKGLVESRPKAGTRITPRNRWNLLDPDILAWSFESEPDRQFVIDLFELRGIIEPAAAELAAQRRTELELKEMAKALDAMETHGLADELGRAGDQLFHRLILMAARNEALASLASTVAAAVHFTTRFKHRRRKSPRDPLPEHREVYTAIANGDGDAARASTAVLLRMALEDMEID